MGIRETINENRAVGVAIVVVALGAAAWIIFGGSGRSKPEAAGSWFYNMDTGEIEAHIMLEPAPVTLPSGAIGVYACYFSCGECTDEKSRFLAYLEKYDKREVPADSSMAGMPIVPGELYVAHPDHPGRWVLSSSPAGQQLVNIRARCPGTTPRRCEPGSFTP